MHVDTGVRYTYGILTMPVVKGSALNGRTIVGRTLVSLIQHRMKVAIVHPGINVHILNRRNFRSVTRQLRNKRHCVALRETFRMVYGFIHLSKVLES